MSRINVTIDRLLLRGFEKGDGGVVAESLKSELSRILSDPASHAQWSRRLRTPILRLPSIRLETGISGRRQCGAGMARAIAKKIK
jgi:hypothetical protein